jgi:hypothetical protein
MRELKMSLSAEQQELTSSNPTRAHLPRVLLKGLGILVSLWLVACTALFAVMHQPPETFGRVMQHVPDAAFLAFPFETLWTHARTGSLHPGDIAPDFSLLKLDKTDTIRLSTLASQKPVVLVFGSYT